MSGWYASWFDSPYYHMLYKHRDHEEAKQFLTRLFQCHPADKGSKVLDKACGRGRHASYLASMGFDVTGTDLSENNILHARRYFGKQAKFDIQDMQEVYKSNHFDMIFSLFTSFGYFDTDEENRHVLDVTFEELKPGGCFVFDYLNPVWVKAHLKEKDSKISQKVKFNIRRSIINDFIIKEIEVEENNEIVRFQEKVKAYTSGILLDMLTKSGFEISSVYGDYSFADFKENESPRIIIFAKKPWTV